MRRLPAPRVVRHALTALHRCRGSPPLSGDPY